MVEVEFIYKQQKINIASNINNIFEEIIQKYIDNTNLDINKIYFLTNGRKINKKDKLENIMSEENKRDKKIVVLVNSINSTIKIDNTNIKISKDIICPECKELCKYEIRDYKIKLYGCKYGHIKENINLNEFENNQIIDISQIKCDICKNKNKSNTFNNEFYLCFECHKNLCPLCKSIHDKSHDKNHSIINYDNKNYVCNKHYKNLIQYCIDCNKDMCLSCSNEHKNHKIVLYKDELIDIKNLRNKMNELKNDIDKFEINIEKIINKLNMMVENMNIIYNINNNILNNYENDNRNYKIVLNLNYMSEYIKNEINNIKNKYNYGYNINRLLNIDEIKLKIIEDKISNTNLKINNNNINNQNILINQNNFENKHKLNQDINKNIIPNKVLNNNHQLQNQNNNKNNKQQLSNNQNNNNDEIIYKPNKGGKVRIFGEYFVNNNKIQCKIIYNSKEYELKEYFNDIDKEYNNKDEIKIKLKGISKVTNMRYMFYNCNTLYSLPDISKWNTYNVTDMSCMFSDCNKLSSLPDISKWDTSNVTNMNSIFYYCNALTSLPDISKWNTSKVTNMNSLFSNCISLTSLPDLSKWDTSKVTNMRAMFHYCNALYSLPDISKWNTSKVTDMSLMFSYCCRLSSLPDISKWNTSKVINMRSMFYNCNTLSSLPDISKWDTFMVTDKRDMFYNCKESLNILSKFKK